jgi:uncharacterized membrane protein YfcA
LKNFDPTILDQGLNNVFLTGTVLLFCGGALSWAGLVVYKQYRGRIMHFLFAFLICFGGGFVQGASSFGYAIICISLLPFVFDLMTSSLVILISSFSMYINLIYNLFWKMKAKISFKLLLVPIVGIFIGRAVGVYLLTYSEAKLLIIFLCAVLLLLSLYFLFYSNKIRIAPSKRNGFCAGLASGVLGGLFNISGPPIVAYFFASIEDKNQYNLYVQVLLLIGALYSLVFHILLGNITERILGLSLIASLGVIAGTICGFKLFKKISKTVMSRLISILVFVVAVMLYIKYWVR